MNNRRIAQFVVLAAVVLVMLPLFIATAAIASHFLFGAVGTTGIFASMGIVEAAGMLWGALAVVIVGSLIGLLVGDVRHA
jgi:hypothetical protein